MSDSVVDEIRSLTERLQSIRPSLNNDTRAKALEAAQGLLDALSSPVESVIQTVALDTALFMAIRMGVQLEAFKVICDCKDKGATIEQIAKWSGASPVVVDQILRLLASKKYVLEAGVQVYKPSARTFILADPVMEAMARSCLDVGAYCTMYGPDYFRRNGNQLPKSVLDTPFQLAKNTQLSYFDWMRENPAAAKDFQLWMTAKQHSAPNWVDWFDVQSAILDGVFEPQPASNDNVLFIDIGGGEGHYLHAFNRKFPEAPGRRVLQDLPHVISSISKALDSEGPTIELMPHDFFKPQPIKGARVYYLHWILHDWSDDKAREILENIVAAMEPGYSRLVINDNIIPDRNCGAASACLSIMMMVQVGSIERTEQQWRELLNSVALTDLSFHQPPADGAEGIIVATK
ncbi:sterigmatocystin 8-O-methyltransferase precursor [Aspergillus venezuelensis]